MSHKPHPSKGSLETSIQIIDFTKDSPKGPLIPWVAQLCSPFVLRRVSETTDILSYFFS